MKQQPVLETYAIFAITLGVWIALRPIFAINFIWGLTLNCLKSDSTIGKLVGMAMVAAIMVQPYLVGLTVMLVIFYITCPEIFKKS